MTDPIIYCRLRGGCPGPRPSARIDRDSRRNKDRRRYPGCWGYAGIRRTCIQGNMRHWVLIVSPKVHPKCAGQPVFTTRLIRASSHFVRDPCAQQWSIAVSTRSPNSQLIEVRRPFRLGGSQYPVEAPHEAPPHLQRATATGVNLQSRCLIPLMKGESRRSGSPTLSMSGMRSKSWRNITSISWRAR